MHEPPPIPPLRERKQQRIRESIIEAADSLFEQHGFANVTVTDIARHCDVGRTTFFRYFGDKQEVMFADEQNYVEMLTEREHATTTDGAGTLGEGIDQLRPIVLQMCRHAVRNPDRYRLHERLILENPELRDRDNRKLEKYCSALRGILTARGVDDRTASLAAHLALACYHAGRHTARSTSTSLPEAVASAFDQLAAQPE